MVNLTTSTALPIHHRSLDHDETSMPESLIFADSLKDLENLRTKLYSAAEYFELSYTKDDQKPLVVDTLKEYAVQALINTVDHLGSVTYKVSDLLDENVGEVSGTELRVSCIEQRLRTCQEYIDKEGMSQQSSILETPTYHKRYVLPAGQTINGCNLMDLKSKCRVIEDDVWLQFRSAARAMFRDTTSRENASTNKEIPSFVRRACSISPSPRNSQLPGSCAVGGSIPKKEDKRSVSPHRFPLLRSGSFASRLTTPKSSRPTTPDPALERRECLPDSWKSVSMRVHEKQRPKDAERHPSRSKRLLNALLSRRKPKKDDMLFTYLDEY
ncbi:hypothetical protein RND81_14G099400 [Saponaria officinalis]|uniref:Protein ABIL2 n=1 Tax=Saponaria officinalis TaxID=3572 RepID=A0AAW1GS85_SAPOF